LNLIKNVMNNLKYIPIFLIVLYKHAVSPLLPICCRFTPTCSTYAIEAFSKYGIMKGLVLTIMRIGKCHPFHPGGYDPVK